MEVSAKARENGERYAALTAQNAAAAVERNGQRKAGDEAPDRVPHNRLSALGGHCARLDVEEGIRQGLDDVAHGRNRPVRRVFGRDSLQK